MEELINQISKKWISFGNDNLKFETKFWIEKYKNNPFEVLPEDKSLTNEEYRWLKAIENKEEWNGEEYSKIHKLRLRKGLLKSIHELRRKNFQKILDECKNESLTLPKNFVELIMNDKIIDRFRCQWSEFINFHKLIKFPNYNSIFLIPFHQDTQGGCVWFLVIDRKGNHFVLNYPTSVSTDYVFEFEKYKQDIFICAENINEFIIRMSIDFKMIEQENET